MNSQLPTRNFLGISASYFEKEFLPAFTRVSARTSPREVQYEIAGVKISLRFFCELLAERLMPAFAHLPQFSGAPDIVVNIGDGSIMPLTPPWSHADFLQSAADAPLTSFRGVYISGEESVNFYDADSGVAYFWTNDVSVLPGWVVGAPLRAILHWVLSSRDIQLVHAAAVGRGDETVLLTAKSGSGKSTTALSCVLSGMTYLGDDYVGVTAGANDLVAHSLYDSAKMTPNTQKMFPEYAEGVVTVPSVDDRKSVVYLSQIFPERVRTISSVRAILIPSIDSAAEASFLIPARKHEALRALAPTVLFQLPGAGTMLLGRLAEIVSCVPSYHLRLGSDVRAIPSVIDTVFSHHGSI